MVALNVNSNLGFGARKGVVIMHQGKYKFEILRLYGFSEIFWICS